MNQPVSIIDSLYGFIYRKGSFYLINDLKEGIILIDTGYPGSLKKIKRFIQRFDKDLIDINYILISHADGDHVAGLFNLVKASGAQVYMSRETRRYLKKIKNSSHWPFPLNIITSFASKIFVKCPEKINLIKDGDMLNIAGGIKVVSTPGHSPDHLSYYWVSNRVAFVGDILNYFDRLDPSPKFINNDNDELFKSIEKIRLLNAEIICVGHGTNFFRLNENSIRLKQLVGEKN